MAENEIPEVSNHLFYTNKFDDCGLQDYEGSKIHIAARSEEALNVEEDAFRKAGVKYVT